MMSDLSNTYENATATWLFRPTQTASRPAGLWLALLSALTDPETGAVTELTGTGYARVDVSTAFGAPSNGTVSNAAAIIITAAAGGAWGNAVAFALMDAATGGNVVISKALVQSFTILAGTPVRFEAGQLQLSVS